LRPRYERFVQGPSSAYWPYLQILPTLEEIHPPVEYSDAELDALKPSHVYQSIHSYKQEVQSSSRPRSWAAVR
jgi:hypothetical protein